MENRMVYTNFGRSLKIELSTVEGVRAKIRNSIKPNFALFIVAN